MEQEHKRYNDLNAYLRKKFGCRVQKISIDAGLTCPNRDGTISTGGCIYCNAKGSGTGAFDRGKSITDQLLDGKKFLGKRYKANKFIAYFQSFSNTYASFKKLKALYDEALSVEDIVGLSIGTRPDCVNPQILDLLEEYARNYLIWIEYGLQSAHNKTLALINRGHDFEAFINAVEMSKNRGIALCVHVILGLPGETRSDMLNTAKIIAKLRIDGIKLHLLYVVKGTALEKLYNQGKYRCLDRDEYVDLVCDFLELLPQDMIIQRLTGAAHPDELRAPEWSIDKTNLQFIKQRMEERDIRQGKKFS
ncbi:Radical SAM protein, YhcC-like [Candidatus Magnetomoraceae bacterium gMMP-15]